MPFDPTKPVRTRCGFRAEILCTDVSSNFPIVATYWDEYGRRILGCYTREGHFCNDAAPDRLDLINIPEKHTLDLWVNHYPGGYYSSHTTRELADNFLTSAERIACLHIVREFEEGEGL
jgi:hypothetical protein